MPFDFKEPFSGGAPRILNVTAGPCYSPCGESIAAIVSEALNEAVASVKTRMSYKGQFFSNSNPFVGDKKPPQHRWEIAYYNDAELEKLKTALSGKNSLHESYAATENKPSSPGLSGPEGMD